LTGCKFSNGGWSWNKADSLDALALIVGKFSDDVWSWNEVDSLDALHLIGSKFLMVAGP